MMFHENFTDAASVSRSTNLSRIFKSSLIQFTAIINLSHCNTNEFDI